VEIPPSENEKDSGYVVFDAGTGIRNLGNEVVKACPNGQLLRFYLFFTHLHWDHIQGLPFFSPLYRERTQIEVYGPDSSDLEGLLKNQMNPDYFPVTMDDDTVRAQIRFHLLSAEPVRIGPLTVRHHYVNHGPVGTAAGFRADSEEGSFVYIPDIEPYDYSAGLARSPHPEHREGEEKLIEFVRNADVMLFDTMFTEEDYPRHIGWGHSPAKYAVEVAAEAGVKRLGLFHYAPLREDSDIDHLTAVLEESGNKKGVEVFASREGMVIEIEGKYPDVGGD